MKLLGISGSIRKDSYNSRLLRVAQTLLANEATMTMFDIAPIPHYNRDLDSESKPPAVQALLDAIANADALIIATPEYNYSVPGVLKNAIDWASRPAFKSALKGKPTTIVSASMSATGGARAQAHLRAILAGILTPVYLAPDFALPAAQAAFTESGNLADEATEERLRRRLDDFLEWVGDTSS